MNSLYASVREAKHACTVQSRTTLNRSFGIDNLPNIHSISILMRATLVTELTKQLFSSHLYPDVTDRFIRHRQCIWEVKALFYHPRLWYPLKHAPAVQADAHPSGYHKTKWAIMLIWKTKTKQNLDICSTQCWEDQVCICTNFFIFGDIPCHLFFSLFFWYHLARILTTLSIYDNQVTHLSLHVTSVSGPCAWGIIRLS